MPTMMSKSEQRRRDKSTMMKETRFEYLLRGRQVDYGELCKIDWAPVWDLSTNKFGMARPGLARSGGPGRVTSCRRVVAEISFHAQELAWRNVTILNASRPKSSTPAIASDWACIFTKKPKIFASWTPILRRRALLQLTLFGSGSPLSMTWRMDRCLSRAIYLMRRQQNRLDLAPNYVNSTPSVRP